MSHKQGILIGLLASSPILVAFSAPSQATGPLGLDWWIWVLILALALVILAVLVGWWWLGRRPEEEATPPKPVAPPPKPPAAVSEPPPPAPDDLTRIEGIGPKIADLLRETDITTFAQLAATEVSRLAQVLEAAGLQHLADPSTWPEQAMLASAGDWDAFEALQEELKGGRRA